MRHTQRIACLAIGLSWFAATASAEEPRRWNGTFIWGTTAFSDSDAHRTLGATMRIRLFDRWSIEPEFGYATLPDNTFDSARRRTESKHSDLLVTARVVYDFRDESETRVIPYVTVGGGWIQSRYERTTVSTPVENAVPVFPTPPVSESGSWTSTNNALWLGGGFGVRILLPHRFFISPEVSLGSTDGGVTGSAVIKVGYGF